MHAVRSSEIIYLLMYLSYLPISWMILKKKEKILLTKHVIQIVCVCIVYVWCNFFCNFFFLNFSIWNVINSNLSMGKEYTHNIIQRKKQHKVIKWKKNVELGELRWRMRCSQYIHVLFLPNFYYFLIISLESKSNWRMMRKHTK